MTKRVTKKTGAKRDKKSKMEIYEPRPVSSLRGILPIPKEVAELVAKEENGRRWTDEARQRVTDDFKMQYYFGGQYYAYRKTPQGREVLAVGLDEIGELLRRRMSKEERESISSGYAEPWYELA